MKKLLPIITALGVATSLSSAIYLGQINDFSFPQVTVKFCPETANKKRKNREESQAKLDRKYCRYRRRLLKEVWEAEQFRAAIPLSEGSFSIQEFRGDKSGSPWLLLAPVLAGSAYLAWSDKCKSDYDEKFEQLEGLKSYFKLITVSARNERQFKATAINQSWDTQRVKAGQISIDAVQDRLKKQSEIQDRSHSSTVKQFDLNDSQIDKTIAENQVAVAEAAKKLTKLQGQEINDKFDSNRLSSQQLKNSIIEALKNHEDGWLWKVINNKKPIWVLGEAGSGKSTLAASIIMLRQYLFDMPLYQLIDIHAGDNLKKAWKYLNPQLVAQSEEEISGAFDDARERWLDRINNQTDKKQQQLLVDEFTNYSDSDIVKEPARKFVKASLSDPRKAEERLVCIAHYFTNTAAGGGTGSSKGRARGTIQIDRKTADGDTPLSVASLNGLNDSEGEAEVDKKILIPNWLTPDKIHNHFNNKPINLNE
ncbi:ATP-binding protein [Nostoc sp. NMS4]|uniref:ATP-binding protein n=1 Tax=Nostoc sp. NMS4 TaxID=2815390 RepID=UPI0025F7AF76|nr:ATP-binding protein [Nostoc sp. NMS4]MBN3924632.1 ATP-binding protein [Nostoc sp. NMS4]